MKVQELNHDQLSELKQDYYCNHVLKEDEDISYEEMAKINELVSDEKVFNFYANYDFCNEDFFCSLAN